MRAGADLLSLSIFYPQTLATFLAFLVGTQKMFCVSEGVNEWKWDENGYP